MAQGFYPGDTSQSVRAILACAGGLADPTVVPTVGKTGTLYVQFGTLNVWQKQDDGRTVNWVLFGGGGGGGTVTSVGLALPVSVFVVSGSPVVAAGTLTGSFVVQPANTVFAGPTAGAPAIPTFRGLVVADIPVLPYVTAVTASAPLASSGGATPNISLTGIVPVANGGTGQSTYTDGELLIGTSVGNTLVKNTLTAGTNVTIINGPGTITINASNTLATRTIIANDTITAADDILFIDTTGGAINLGLPDPATVVGKIFRLFDIAGTLSTNNLNLTRFAAEMIEGLAATKTFFTDWGGWDVTSNGTNWFIK